LKICYSLYAAHFYGHKDKFAQFLNQFIFTHDILITFFFFIKTVLIVVSVYLLLQKREYTSIKLHAFPTDRNNKDEAETSLKII